jgi:hypothetical protein
VELRSGERLGGPVSSFPQGGRSGKKLFGTTLRAARAVWLAVVLLTVGLYILAIPERDAELLSTFQSLSPAQALILEEMGISGVQHARSVLVLEAAVALVFLMVALVIYVRKSDDWVAMLVSAGLVTYIARISPPLDTLAEARPELWLPTTLVQVLGLTCAIAFLYVFPDGRFVPRWSRFLLAAWVAWAIAWLLMPSSVFDLSDPFRLSVPSFVMLMLWIGSGIAIQTYRYLRVDTPVQRQQTKLILFGMTIALLGYLIFGLNRFAIPILEAPRHAAVVYDLIGVPIFLVIMLVVPVSFAVSILRYRLWDIDLVINRVIVYATLTAILGGMYSATITLSQRLFVALTGQQSDAAIVFTVLVVGATFTYLKGKLQNTVDRYVKPMPDPIKQVRAFGDELRAFCDLLDVEQLTHKILVESVRAFGARGGAVYLLRQGHYEPAYVEGEWDQVEGMSVWLDSEGERYGWISLGPRLNGLAYSDQDRAVFEDMTTLVARTMRLLAAVRVRVAEPAAAGSGRSDRLAS